MVQSAIDRDPSRKRVNEERVVADAPAIVAEMKMRQGSLSAALARWDYGEAPT